jgi:alpha-1,2-mannosyltransferase
MLLSREDAAAGRRPRVVTWRSAAVVAVLAAPLLVFQVGAADLDVYRHGGVAFLHGHSLYAPAFAAHLGTHLPFTYPPFAAAAAVVLLPIPALVSPWVWATVTVVLLAWCVQISFGAALSRTRLPPDLTLALLIAVVLYTRPVFDHLGDGQVDIALMALCLVDTTTPQPRWPRGLLVGIATAIKLVPGIFIPFLWITGRRRAAAVAAGTFVLCEALAALGSFGDSRRYWTRLIFDTERPGYTAGYKNQSLRGLGLRILPVPGRTVLLVAAAVIIVAVGLVRARQASARGQVVTGATITGLVGVLASPVSWIHATVWIIPALGILVGRATSRWRVGLAAAVTIALLAGLPYAPNVVHGLPGPAITLLQASFGLICLTLVLTLPTSAHPNEKSRLTSPQLRPQN